MSNELKLVVRTLLTAIVTFSVAWQAAGFSFEKSALGGAAVAGVQVLLELIGPTSDVGIPWTVGKPPAQPPAAK